MGEKWRLKDGRVKCLRCGYEWMPHKDNLANNYSGLPSNCAGCRTQHWYIPVKSKQAKNKRIKNAKGVLVNEE